MGSEQPRAGGCKKAEEEVAIQWSDPGLARGDQHPQWQVCPEHLVFEFILQMRKLRPRRGSYLYRLRAETWSQVLQLPGSDIPPSLKLLSQCGPGGVTAHPPPHPSSKSQPGRQPRFWVTQTVGNSNSSVLVLFAVGGGGQPRGGPRLANLFSAAVMVQVAT